MMGSEIGIGVPLVRVPFWGIILWGPHFRATLCTGTHVWKAPQRRLASLLGKLMNLAVTSLLIWCHTGQPRAHESNHD